jgi:hypothetical protein
MFRRYGDRACARAGVGGGPFDRSTARAGAATLSVRRCPSQARRGGLRGGFAEGGAVDGDGVAAVLEAGEQGRHHRRVPEEPGPFVVAEIRGDYVESRVKDFVGVPSSLGFFEVVFRGSFGSAAALARVKRARRRRASLSWSGPDLAGFLVVLFGGGEGGGWNGKRAPGDVLSSCPTGRPWRDSSSGGFPLGCVVTRAAA